MPLIILGVILLFIGNVPLGIVSIILGLMINSLKEE